MKLEYPVVIDLPVTIDEWIVSENDLVKAGQEIARFLLRTRTEREERPCSSFFLRTGLMT